MLHTSPCGHVRDNYGGDPGAAGYPGSSMGAYGSRMVGGWSAEGRMIAPMGGPGGMGGHGTGAYGADGHDGSAGRCDGSDVRATPQFPRRCEHACSPDAVRAHRARVQSTSIRFLRSSHTSAPCASASSPTACPSARCHSMQLPSRSQRHHRALPGGGRVLCDAVGAFGALESVRMLPEKRQAFINFIEHQAAQLLMMTTGGQARAVSGCEHRRPRAVSHAARLERASWADNPRCGRQPSRWQAALAVAGPSCRRCDSLRFGRSCCTASR